MTIGESIRYHRKRQRLTQTQLAERIGVSAQAISKWETDAGMPDTAILVPLARALGTTTDELLRFGERYQEFERQWKNTLHEFGDDPEKLLEVSFAALREFPFDWSFLYRTAVNQWRIAEMLTDPEEKRTLLNRAAVNAQLLYEMDMQNDSAIWIRNEIKIELEKLCKE